VEPLRYCDKIDDIILIRDTDHTRMIKSEKQSSWLASLCVI